jgi:hypothetical protein
MFFTILFEGQRTRHVSSVKAIIILSICCLFSVRPCTPQTNPAGLGTQTETVSTEVMGQYQEITQRVMVAHQRGNSEEAVKMALSLEGLWDRSEGEMQSGHPETWKSIDHAMDVFIKPIVDYSRETPNDAELDTAFQAYVGALDRANTIVR